MIWPFVGGRGAVGAADEIAVAPKVGEECTNSVRKSLSVGHAENREGQSIGGESGGDSLGLEVTKVPIEICLCDSDDVVGDIEGGDVLVAENSAQEGVEAPLLTGLYASFVLVAAEEAARAGKSEASLSGRECAGKRVEHNVAWLGVARDELAAERDTLLLWAQP